MVAPDLTSRVRAEGSLLGALLIDPAKINDVVQILEGSEFAEQSHEVIYRALVGLSQKGRPVDLVILTNELERDGMLERAGGVGYLAALLDDVPDVQNAIHYAHQVRDASLRRRMAQTATRVAAGATSARDAVDVLEAAQEALAGLSGGSARRAERAGALAHANVRSARGRLGATGLAGLPTGFRDLDKLTMGFSRGELIVVAGRPGMGKTAFALHQAFAQARGGYKVLFASLEMGGPQVIRRLQSSVTGVEGSRIKAGVLTRAERRALYVSAAWLEQWPLWIDDSSAMTVVELRAKATGMARTTGLDVVFVDYLQIMGTRSQGRNENREREVGALSRGLKALARDLDVVVVALAQLSRRVEQRGADKEPQLSDLRESGAIEQDADSVLFLSRPDYYGDDGRGLCDVIVAKARDGATGKVTLGWADSLTRFGDLREEQ